MRSNVSELVSRIEGYNEAKFEVVSIYKDKDDEHYNVEVQIIEPTEEK
jgi:hypothetical protein